MTGYARLPLVFKLLHIGRCRWADRLLLENSCGARAWPRVRFCFRNVTQLSCDPESVPCSKLFVVRCGMFGMTRCAILLPCPSDVLCYRQTVRSCESVSLPSLQALEVIT